jgi:hypothetical protein
VRRFLRVAGVLLILLLTAGGIALFLGYRATQQVPDFYGQAIQLEPEVQQEAGDVLEQHVLQLHNEVRQSGRWEAVFTDQQINGWLAYDLPEKFADVLPPGVSDPRVVIEDRQARIACRYDAKRFRSVISLDLEIHLTEEPNVLAVRIHQARAGLLPLPLKRFLDEITAQAGTADVIVRWSQDDGDPVALVTVPTRHDQYPRREVHLETVELRDGEVYLAGRSLDETAGQQASTESPERKRQIQR